jgi:hypothetical protein
MNLYKIQIPILTYKLNSGPFSGSSWPAKTGPWSRSTVSAPAAGSPGSSGGGSGTVVPWISFGSEWTVFAFLWRRSFKGCLDALVRNLFTWFPRNLGLGMNLLSKLWACFFLNSFIWLYFSWFWVNIFIFSSWIYFWLSFLNSFIKLVFCCLLSYIIYWI